MGEEQGTRGWTNLAETDGGGLFTETLTTEVKAVFTDNTSLVGTQTTREARRRNQSEKCSTRGLIVAPLARALSVFSGTREPNGVVCHGEMICRKVAVEEPLSETG